VIVRSVFLSVLRVWSHASITPSRLKSRYTRRVRFVCFSGSGVGDGVGEAVGVGEGDAVAVGDGVAVSDGVGVGGVSWARAAAGAASASATTRAGPEKARVMRMRTPTILPRRAIMPAP
jgi:hypothetical protein